MSPVAKAEEPEKPDNATAVVVESTQTKEKVKESRGKDKKDKKRKPEDEVRFVQANSLTEISWNV